jgi:hypothetical protein
MEIHCRQAAQPADTRYLRKQRPQVGRQQQVVLAGCGIQGPPGVPAQLLLEPPRPEKPEPDLAASQSDGLTNRRMRARMSGGVGGGGATPPPTRSVILVGPRLERREDGPVPRWRARRERSGENPCGPVPLLQPGGRPPCAADAKAEWPHSSGGSLRAQRARPPGDPARHHVLLPGCAHARRGRAVGARRASRAFKAVLRILTSQIRQDTARCPVPLDALHGGFKGSAQRLGESRRFSMS